eukprot:4086454-Alexandrium_andersonii.AAC.1
MTCGHLIERHAVHIKQRDFERICHEIELASEAGKNILADQERGRTARHGGRPHEQARIAEAHGDA